MEKYEKGLLFEDPLMQQIASRFEYLNEDPAIGERIFFENAGGSLRLKESGQRFSELGAFPDCPSRRHDRAVSLNAVIKKGIEDTRIIFNAQDGEIIIGLTATMNMFRMVETVLQNIPGKNIVTSVLEHPSVFDSMSYYGKATSREVRVAKSCAATGGIAVEEVLRLIDQDTALLAITAASNITGTILDIESLVTKARQIKPDLYIIIDAVQHAPHSSLDLMKAPVDGINIALYKFFGQRGYSMAYISDRMAKLTHPRILNDKLINWQLGSPVPAFYSDITVITDYVCWIGGHFTTSTDRRTLFESGMEHIKLHERALLSYMLDGTSNQNGLRMIDNVIVHLDNPDLTQRDLIVPISFKNISCPDAVTEYKKHKVIVFERMADSHYSKNALNSFGVKGVIRVSPLHCHSVNDISRFLQATKEIALL
ncbi:MAG: aminotransferase class V-fold PLP-dependent enzyme [Clostridiaceae bacterium]|nr:aminotransferase class V-fold PLP-dependent enzyme [Clostridiaceae bacterium]